MIKLAVFDLDGTLADTVESIAFAANKALRTCGLAEQPVENYQYYAGDGADVLIKRALAASGDPEGTHFEEAFKEYQGFFETDCTYRVKVFDGILELLQELKQRKIKIAVVSNKPHLRTVTVVETLFGKGMFDCILGQKDNLPKKPDPAGTLIVAQTLGAAPAESIYIGDTDVDMKTGNRAEMFTVGVLWGFRTREELQKNNAHAIVETPLEILTLL